MKLQILKICASLLVCLLSSSIAHAVAYVYPGATAPLILSSATADTLTVQSGTMQTTSITAYTVSISGSNLAGSTAVTVNSGATIGYAGTNAFGAAISGSFNSAVAIANTITNNGTITASSTGLFSIYVTNSNTGLPNVSLTIDNNSTISGSISVSNMCDAATGFTLNLNGAATVAGGVQGAGGTVRRVRVGPTTACNFTSGGVYDGLTLIQVFNGSSFTQTYAFTEIAALTINAGGTYNVNNTLGGLSAGDGAITNDGTLNISANITKTGTFATSSTTRTKQIVSVSTSTLTNTGTYIASFYDQNNQGTMTYTGADGPTFNTFTLEYTGGYLNTNTYTLFTSSNVDIATPPVTVNKPTNTLFLSFGTPTVGTRTITSTITRTPYNNYTSTPYAQNIAIALEQIGNSSPSSTELAVLDGVEACTTANCVQSAMLQLGPLVSAPLYAYTIENVTLRQAQLRLAALRNNDYYIAGDEKDYDAFIMGNLLRENYVWFRPFAAYANQGAVDDIIGYYATTGGFAFGLERNLDARYNLGMALAYGFSNVKDKINAYSNTTIKSYQGILYGTYNFTKSRYVDWLASVTGNQYNGRRYMAINSFVATANSKYSGQLFTAKAIWGQECSAFDFLQYTPEASVMYTFAKQYTYQEVNAGGANLEVQRQNANSVQLGIGTKLAVPLAIMPSVVVPEIRTMYYYNLVNGGQNCSWSFISGSNSVLSTMSPPRSTILIGASLTVAVFDSLQVKGAIDAQYADRYNSYWVYLNLKYLL